MTCRNKRAQRDGNCTCSRARSKKPPFGLCHARIRAPANAVNVENSSYTGRDYRSPMSNRWVNAFPTLFSGFGGIWWCRYFFGALALDAFEASNVTLGSSYDSGQQQPTFLMQVVLKTSLMVMRLAGIGCNIFSMRRLMDGGSIKLNSLPHFGWPSRPSKISPSGWCSSHASQPFLNLA
jgi:hypothetical protein